MRIVKRQRGQAMVEFALIAMVLVVLLLAIIQFGIVYSHYVAVTDAAREGARSAVVNRSAGQAGMVNAGTAAARGAVPNLNSGQVAVTITSGTGASGPWSQGAPITVNVRYPYTIEIVGWAMKSGDLSSSTTMRTE